MPPWPLLSWVSYLSASSLRGVSGYWNWGTGEFYPPVWPGYPAWRPPYPGWRPGMPVGGGGNINIGNGINIGNRPWQPDRDRYRPGGRPPPRGTGGGIGGRPGLGGGVGGWPGLGGGTNRPAARPTPATRPAARPAAGPARLKACLAWRKKSRLFKRKVEGASDE
jgi:hypothetical protein